MASIRPIKGKKATTYKVETTIDGVRVPSKTFKKKADAERYAASLTLQSSNLIDNSFKILSCTTLSDIVEVYLSRYKGKDSSLPQRLCYWNEKLGEQTLDKLTKRSIKACLEELSETGKSNATVNRYKSALSAVFTKACDIYDIDTNPCKGIKNLPEGTPCDNWATPEEVTSILNASKASSWPKMYLFVLMAIQTGMRRSSLLSLRWDFIDFNNGTVYQPTSKNDKPILLPITDAVLKELRAHREIGTGFVFPHPSNPNQWFANIDSHWKLCLKRSGIDKHLRIHDLRHTTGSWLAQAGVPLTEIKEIMTHKTIQTTQRYIHHDLNSKSNSIRSVFGKVK